MKNIKYVSVLAVLALLSLASCSKKSTTPTESQISDMRENGKKICEKVTDCAMERLKGLPEAQRKMAEGMMARSKDACLGQYGANGKTAEATSEKIEYTKEEMELGQKCLSEMMKASCQDLMNPATQPASCKQFQEISVKKHASK